MTLADLIRNGFPKTRVMLIGDIMLDRYLIGEVERISPEAPVPVLTYKESVLRAGGLANVALNLKVLGAEVLPISIIGEDEHGNRLLEILEDEGFGVEGILSVNGRRTTVKTRIVAGGQQLLRIDEEEDSEINSIIEKELWNRINKNIDDQRPEIILFQDYNKGVLTEGIIRQTIDVAKEKGIMTAVDPKKKHFFTYRGVDLLKPNLKEVSDALHVSCPGQLQELGVCAKQMEERLGFKYCFITLSSKGIFGYAPPDTSLIVPAKTKDVVDVCGAGDAVLSVVSLAMYHGLGVEEAAKLGNIAGGIVCGIAGVSPLIRQHWEEELKGLDVS